MNLFINTSTPLCRVLLEVDETLHVYEWQADRQLAKGLLGYVERCLGEHDKKLADIQGIGVYQGPGSFTGLRIGLTVMNTLADGLGVPIVGVTGEEWAAIAQKRLQLGENDHLVLPNYGADAHITKPRK